MTVPVCPPGLWQEVVKELARCILEAERNTGSAPQRAERPVAQSGTAWPPSTVRVVPGDPGGQETGAA